MRYPFNLSTFLSNVKKIINALPAGSQVRYAHIQTSDHMLLIKKDVNKRSFSVSTGDEEAKDKDLTSISLECFSAAIVMAKVKSLSPRTLILTSGTLPPMEDIETDFGIPFPIKLQNPHVFS